MDTLGSTPVSLNIARKWERKISTARVLLVYPQLDKSKREIVEKHVA